MLEKQGGRDDRNAAERIESEQTGVAANNQIGPSVHRQFEELVIGRIAAGHNPLDNRDCLGRGNQFMHPVPNVRANQVDKVRPSYNLK